MGMCVAVCMRKAQADVVELGDMEGPVLTALISSMYGKLDDIPAALTLPLFLAADKFQVGGHVAMSLSTELDSFSCITSSPWQNLSYAYAA